MHLAPTTTPSIQGYKVCYEQAWVSNWTRRCSGHIHLVPWRKMTQIFPGYLIHPWRAEHMNKWLGSWFYMCWYSLVFYPKNCDDHIRWPENIEYGGCMHHIVSSIFCGKSNLAWGKIRDNTKMYKVIYNAEPLHFMGKLCFRWRFPRQKFSEMGDVPPSSYQPGQPGSANSSWFYIGCKNM